MRPSPLNFVARRPAAPLVLAALLVLPSPALSQRMPGMPGSQGGSAAQNLAAFYADVMAHVNASIQAWSDAWARDDVASLSEIYTEDAVLVLPGRQPVWGRDAIRETLGSQLVSLGEAQTSVGDIKASGRIAYVGGLFVLQIQSGQGAGDQIDGFHSTVFFREAGDWRIRSQVFRPRVEDEP